MTGDGSRVRRRIRGFQSFPLTTAVMVQAFALFVSVISFAAYAWVQTSHRAESDAVVNCRGRTTAVLSAASATTSLALDNLVIALADPSRRNEDPPYSPEIAALKRSAAALQQAADARTAFEDHPTGDC